MCNSLNKTIPLHEYSNLRHGRISDDSLLKDERTEGQLSGYCTNICTAIVTMKHFTTVKLTLFLNQIPWWHGNYSRFLPFFCLRLPPLVAPTPSNFFCHNINMLILLIFFALVRHTCYTTLNFFESSLARGTSIM